MLLINILENYKEIHNMEKFREYLSEGKEIPAEIRNSIAENKKNQLKLAKLLSKYYGEFRDADKNSKLLKSFEDIKFGLNQIEMYIRK